MQNNVGLAPHEMLELHELMNSEIVSLKRTESSMSMVNDNELKNYMQQCLNSKKLALQQMQNFINNQCNLGNNQNNNANQNNQNSQQNNQQNSPQSNQQNNGQNNQQNNQQNFQNYQSGGASDQNSTG